MIKFWTTSLLVPQVAGEIIGLCAKPKNARQVLGLDIYETQLLCRHFQVELVFQLYRRYHNDPKPMTTFMNAYFHPHQAAMLNAQFDRLKKTLKKDLGFTKALQREETKYIIGRRAAQKRKEMEIQKSAEGQNSPLKIAEQSSTINQKDASEDQVLSQKAKTKPQKNDKSKITKKAPEKQKKKTNIKTKYSMRAHNNKSSNSKQSKFIPGIKLVDDGTTYVIVFSIYTL